VPKVPGHHLGPGAGQMPLLQAGTGSIPLSKDHLNKELAAPHRK